MGHLGQIFGHLRAIFGPSWAILGPRAFKITPADFACEVGSPSWTILGPIWDLENITKCALFLLRIGSEILKNSGTVVRQLLDHF